MFNYTFIPSELNSLDSLQFSGKDCIKNTIRWLKDEAEERCRPDFAAVTWQVDVLKDIPLQENDYDCGVFTIM